MSVSRTCHNFRSHCLGEHLIGSDLVSRGHLIGSVLVSGGHVIGSDLVT